MSKWCGDENCLQCADKEPDPYVHLPRADYEALREQNRVLRGLVVHVEQIEADLHAALNGTRHDPSWIRPIQLSRNERQELYFDCIKQLQALKAALTATSQEGQHESR